jgi:hypothetical protein
MSKTWTNARRLQKCHRSVTADRSQGIVVQFAFLTCGDLTVERIVAAYSLILSLASKPPSISKPMDCYSFASYTCCTILVNLSPKYFVGLLNYV